MRKARKTGGTSSRVLRPEQPSSPCSRRARDVFRTRRNHAGQRSPRRSAMSHVSFYRKWRPQAFDEIIGQDRVTRTLQNAIRTNRVVHAYLFAGHRGTGKTTTARILAKALNCVNGPTPTPDGTCPNCQAIAGGHALDVIEIDAATNRGIEEIRELRDRIRLAPTEGRYKVYIIDEAHMLTTEAANALLKTLEEPPAHAVFILCTTEAEKLPDTVRSRCAEVKFGKPSIEEITDKLERVAKGEDMRIEKGDMRDIAKAAGGSFRDAIKLLEQVMLAGGDVKKVIDDTDPEEFLEMGMDEALKLIDKLAENGTNLRGFVERCVEVLRDKLLETRDVGLIGKIEGLEKAYERMKTSAVAQLPLEIFVIENMTNSKPQTPGHNEVPK